MLSQKCFLLLENNVHHSCPHTCLWGWLLRMKLLEWPEEAKLASCPKHVVLEITFCSFKISLKYIPFYRFTPVAFFICYVEISMLVRISPA